MGAALAMGRALLWKDPESSVAPSCKAAAGRCRLWTGRWPPSHVEAASAPIPDTQTPAWKQTRLLSPKASSSWCLLWQPERAKTHRSSRMALASSLLGCPEEGCWELARGRRSRTDACMWGCWPELRLMLGLRQAVFHGGRPAPPSPQQCVRLRVLQAPRPLLPGCDRRSGGDETPSCWEADLCFPVTTLSECLFTVMLTVSISSEVCLFGSFAHFRIGLFVFLLLRYSLLLEAFGLCRPGSLGLLSSLMWLTSHSAWLTPPCSSLLPSVASFPRWGSSHPWGSRGPLSPTETRLLAMGTPHLTLPWAFLPKCVSSSLLGLSLQPSFDHDCPPWSHVCDAAPHLASRPRLPEQFPFRRLA